MKLLNVKTLNIMDSVIFMNIEVVRQPRTEYILFWKVFKGLSEIFHRLEVAPKRNFEYHWSTVPCVSETIWACN